MQDIVFKRVSTQTKVSHPDPSPVVTVTPVSDTSKVVEYYLQATNSLAARIQRAVLPQSRRFTVLEAARNPQPALAQTLSTYRPKLALVPKLPRLDSGPLREQLATPLGKLSIIQGVAIVVLFVVVAVVASSKKTISLIPANNSLGAISYRSFLPTTGSAKQTSQTEQLADVTSSTLPLEVWATPWNLTSLQGKTFRSISAFWGTVASDGISIQPKASWTGWESFVTSQANPHPNYFLTVSGDPNLTSETLADPNKRAQHISALVAVAEQHQFNGIDIDYEGLGKENSDIFTTFVQELSSQLHAANLLLAVTVEARLNNDVPMDWYQIGKSADEVRVMAYDYHASKTGTPGTIAPIGWIQEILTYAQSKVSSGKLVIGLGDYGYDWQQGTDGSWKGTGISGDQALALAAQYKQSITRQTGIDPNGYDIGSIPEFSYTDATGAKHDVWFEDASSLQAKEALVTQFHPAGVIFWTIGLTSSS